MTALPHYHFENAFLSPVVWFPQRFVMNVQLLCEFLSFHLNSLVWYLLSVVVDVDCLSWGSCLTGYYLYHPSWGSCLTGFYLYHLAGVPLPRFLWTLYAVDFGFFLAVDLVGVWCVVLVMVLDFGVMCGELSLAFLSCCQILTFDLNKKPASFKRLNSIKTSWDAT